MIPDILYQHILVVGIVLIIGVFFSWRAARRGRESSSQQISALHPTASKDDDDDKDPFVVAIYAQNGKELYRWTDVIGIEIDNNVMCLKRSDDRSYFSSSLHWIVF